MFIQKSQKCQTKSCASERTRTHDLSISNRFLRRNKSLLFPWKKDANSLEEKRHNLSYGLRAVIFLLNPSDLKKSVPIIENEFQLQCSLFFYVKVTIIVKILVKKINHLLIFAKVRKIACQESTYSSVHGRNYFRNSEAQNIWNTIQAPSF